MKATLGWSYRQATTTSKLPPNWVNKKTNNGLKVVYFVKTSNVPIALVINID
jgi:hypothetical protein